MAKIESKENEKRVELSFVDITAATRVGEGLDI